jgi:hypothetical protein
MPTIEKNNGDDQRRAETHLHTFEQLREHIDEQGRLIWQNCSKYSIQMIGINISLWFHHNERDHAM